MAQHAPDNVYTFKAKFGGKCCQCHGQIKKGERMAWVRGTYQAHESCHHEASVKQDLLVHADLDEIDRDAAEDIYWSNRAAEEERKAEEAAYPAKAARDELCPSEG